MEQLRLRLEEDGKWRSSNPHVQHWLNLWFGERYIPMMSYNPQGRLNTIAREAAAVLGADMVWLKTYPPASKERIY